VNVVYVNEKQTYSSISYARKDLSREILIQNVIGTTSSVMVKKELLEKVGCFDTSMPAMQDYDLWIRICQETLVGVVTEEKVHYYNYTGKKQISSNIKKYEESRNLINKKYAELYRQLNKKELRTIELNSISARVNLALRN